MNFFRKYRILKIIGIVVLTGMAAVFGISRYISAHYREEIQAKLPAMAAKASDSLYVVTAGDFQVNVIGRSISVFDLHVRPDSAVVARRRSEGRLPAMLLDITVPEIEISGLKLGNFKAVKEVVCRTADIYHPKILVTFTDTSVRDRSAQAAKRSTLERVFAKALNIHDPEVNVLLGEGDIAPGIRAKGGELLLKEWEYRPGQNSGDKRFFFAKEGDIELYNVAFRKAGMLYAFGVDTIQLLSAAHTATLHGVYVKPSVSKPAFYRDVKVQKEIYQGAFPLVEVTGLRWEDLLQHKGLKAARIDMTNPDLDIYVSRLYPSNTLSKVGNYPHELLRKLEFPVNIPVVNLYRGAFHYTEVSEKTKRPGILDFTNINGDITGITNQPSAIANQEHCRIRFVAKFMRKSNLGAAFDFPLAATQGEFNVKGRLMELNGSLLSEAAKALALAEIKSLQVHRLDFDICGNDHSADGNITIRYNDLKVKIKKLDEETQQLRNRGFISFVANELLLYNDNPMEGEPVRIANTHVVRDSTKSFFNLIWRSLFQAGIQTAVRQEGITDLVKHRQANKGKQKLHFFRELFPKRSKEQKALMQQRKARRLSKRSSYPSRTSTGPQ